MSFKFFKKEAVKNSTDLEGMVVELPKSKVEITLTKLINDHDAILNMHGYANGDHLVKIGDKDEMSVNDLVKKHMEACNEIESLKKPKEEGVENAEEDEDEKKKKKENEEGEDAEKRAASEEKKTKNEADEKAKADAKAAAKVKADALKNAGPGSASEMPAVSIDLPQDQIERGLKRYG